MLEVLKKKREEEKLEELNKPLPSPKRADDGRRPKTREKQQKKKKKAKKDKNVVANAQSARRKIAGLVKGGFVKGQRVSEDLRREEQQVAIGHAALGNGSFLLASHDFEGAAVALAACWEAWEPSYLGESYFTEGTYGGEEDSSSGGSDCETDSEASEDSHVSEIDGKDMELAAAVHIEKSANERAAFLFFKKHGKANGPGNCARQGFFHRHGRERIQQGSSEDGGGSDAHEAAREVSVRKPVSVMTDEFAEQVQSALLQELLACADEDALEIALEAQEEATAYGGEEEEEELDFEDDTEAQLQAVFNTSAPGGPADRTGWSAAYVSHKPTVYHLTLLVRSMSNTYIRLRRWADLHKFLKDVLLYFDKTGSRAIPKFSHKREEDLWVYIIIRRGLAAACLADKNHLGDAKILLELASRVQPKNHDIIDALEKLRFLEIQMPSFSGKKAEDVFLAQAKLYLTHPEP